MRSRRRGFTLVELLVVLVIIALLLAIALKSLIGQQGQRELVSSIDTFSSDIRWARSQAAKTGNMVYIAFLYEGSEIVLDNSNLSLDVIPNIYDQNQLTPPFDHVNYVHYPPSTGVWDTGVAVPPDNPGIKRSCKGYIVVEAKPRFHQGTPEPFIRNSGSNSNQYLASEWGTPGIDGVQYATPAGTPYTFRDYLGDLWMAEQGYPGTFKRPLEPIYPKNDSLTNAVLSYNSIARDESNINRDSVPAVFYPFMLYGDSSSGTTYQTTSGYLGDDFLTALAERDTTFLRGDYVQACKMFSTGMRDEIINYNIDYSTEFTTNADGQLIEQQTSDPLDHPKMDQQIVDYVQILKRTLPEHVYLVNPYQAKFMVEWNSATNEENWEDFQYLQFILGIDPQGRVTVKEWTFRPDYFPTGSPQNNGVLTHGTISTRNALPQLRTVYMVTDNALDFVGSSVNVASVAASDSQSNGRAYTFWPLVGKYYVDSYTPNDQQFWIPDYDLRLDSNPAAHGGDPNWRPEYILSYGYTRNYLTPKT